MDIPGERLSKFVGVWEDLKASPQITNILKFGHKFKFDKLPPLSEPLPSHVTRLSPAVATVIRKEIKDLVAKKAMRKITYKYATEVPGFYSKLFVVKKPEVGKFRVIINLKPLNEYIKKESFKMEGLRDVKTLVTPQCYGGVADISDAYYHVPISKKSRKYTRFIFENCIYEYCALPMGLTDSPRVFTHITKFVQGFLRKKNIDLVMYIDDILILGVSFEDCERNICILLDLLRKLGFLLNQKKCNLVPNKQFTFLGFIWNTDSWTVALKPEREVKIREAAHNLRKSESVTCRQVAAFLGRTQSTVLAVPLARARVRYLQWEFIASCVKERDYNKEMRISEKADQELVFWEQLPEGLVLPITLPVSTATVTTDASEFGLAVYFDGDLFSEQISPEFLDFSINVKELLALDRWLDTLGSDVTNIHVTWRVDNNSALAAIRNQGSTKSWPMCLLSISILNKALTRNIQISPIRVSSEENIIADAGSRFKQVQDWSLNQSIVSKIFHRYGVPDVDLMATQMSRKVPLYYAWNRQDPEAWGIDSLAQDVDWAAFALPYLFPPFPLLGQVLRKVVDQRVKRMLLVAPWWPTKPFFSTLMSLTLEVRRFRFHKHQVMDMTTGSSPQDIKRCRLAVFLITGIAEEKLTSSQKKLKTWLEPHGEVQQRNITAQHGQNGAAIVENREFQQLPLL